MPAGTISGGVFDPNRDQQFGASVRAVGPILATSNNAIGYDSGGAAGGTVTQATSKATAVTLNQVSGQITMNNASLANATGVAFTLNNSLIGANDVPVVAILSGATANTYLVGVQAVAAGSCIIAVYNYSGSSQTDTLVLQFNLTKGTKT